MVEKTDRTKRKGTLRQEIIASASRDAVTGNWIPTSVTVNAWLETSGAAACVAKDFGLDRDGLLTRVDALDYTRLVGAIYAAYQRRYKRREWLQALRGKV